MDMSPNIAMKDDGESTSECQYCHDLKIKHGSAQHLFDEFMNAISRNSCQFCAILLKAMREFVSDLFDEKEIMEHYKDTNISCDVLEDGRVLVRTHKDGWSTKRGKFQLYLTNEMEQSVNLGQSQRDIAKIAGDPSMWEFLRSCLSNCIHQHPNCVQWQQNAWCPKRLLFLDETKAGSCEARLIETRSERPKSSYIALSHCWGRKSHFCSMKDNIHQLRKHVDLNKLPNTFRDCVTVARELGIHYIWIDSLCILQDDRTDWALQSQDMDKIYHNAFLTVAALVSPSSSVPFLGSNAPSLRRHCQPISITFGNPSKTVKVRDYSILFRDFLPDGHPLRERAWAWQERLFSRRNILFCQQQVVWWCETLESSESGSVSNTKPSPLEHVATQSPPKMLRSWFDLVRDYSPLELTYFTDRLPALSGVASRFKRPNSLYLAGLWSDNLPLCLAWQRREVHDSSTLQRALQYSPDNKVPSSSWASINNQAQWACFSDIKYDKNTGRELESGPDDDFEIQNISEVLKIHCRPSTENAFGEVEHGSYLDLKGQVIKAQLVCNIYGCGHVERKGFKPRLVVPDCQIPIDEECNAPVSSDPERLVDCTEYEPWLKRATEQNNSNLNEDKRVSGPVLCLLLFTGKLKGRHPACVLILSPHPEFEGTYQRLGIGHGDFGLGSPLYKSRKDWACWKDWQDLEEWENWEEWFADAEARVIRVA